MGRRAKSPKGKAETKRSRSGKSRKNAGSNVHDLETRLADALKREAEALEQLQRRNRELAESQEQQTATSEILRVISSSPTDVQPVFDTIVRNAAHLCSALDAVVYLVEGTESVLVAKHGPLAFAEVGDTLPDHARIRARSCHDRSASDPCRGPVECR
jgi:hypothetical protein